jgi:hypothetical protein
MAKTIALWFSFAFIVVGIIVLLTHKKKKQIGETPFQTKEKELAKSIDDCNNFEDIGALRKSVTEFIAANIGTVHPETLSAVEFRLKDALEEMEYDLGKVNRIKGMNLPTHN